MPRAVATALVFPCMAFLLLLTQHTIMAATVHDDTTSTTTSAAAAVSVPTTPSANTVLSFAGMTTTRKLSGTRKKVGGGYDRNKKVKNEPSDKVVMSEMEESSRGDVAKEAAVKASASNTISNTGGKKGAAAAAAASGEGGGKKGGAEGDTIPSQGKKMNGGKKTALCEIELIQPRQADGMTNGMTCNPCGDGETMQNTGGYLPPVDIPDFPLLTLPDVATFTCGCALLFGSFPIFSKETCSAFQAFVTGNGNCGCTTPAPTVAPTAAPTCSPDSLVWTQLGQDIDGEAELDLSGISVSLSADGRTVAIGARLNNGPDSTNSNRGHVRIFYYDVGSSMWTQRGQDIDGEAANDESGQSVSLSADGRTVAIGAIGNDGNNGNLFNIGHARIYQYDDSAGMWMQLGQDIDGETIGDRSGTSVSLSADGRTIAIGAVQNAGNDGTDSNSGHTRIFQYDVGSSTWMQLGQDIDGEEPDDQSGVSVSLSADGRTVAIGAGFNMGDNNDFARGHARIFQYDVDSSMWNQLGQDIDGEAAEDGSGTSVSLSADGRTVVIGAPQNDGNDGADSTSGHARIFQYDDSAGMWMQLGQDIDGEDPDDQSGRSVSISADGRTVAVGASQNDGNDSLEPNSGHARIFQYDDASSMWKQVGQDIDGEAEFDFSGRSVSLSVDGRTVAIGAEQNDGNDGTVSSSGHTRIYELSCSL
jgi:hypothetical protein